MATIKTLSIDLETYSDADIKKTGAYKYAESPAFEILLFGVSVNGGPVTVYDLACGERIPDDILTALSDNTVTKYAYNASFERICLSVYLRRHYPQYFKSYGDPEDTVSNYLDPAAWRCTLVWAAYNGLPLSLAMVGKVLGLEEQKMTEGKDLIRYFCSPCKPTKSNGGRTRNLPEHDMQKWETFKAYNRRDVEVEMQIQQRLKNYPVPDFVWDEYHQDQQINDRGILIDQDVVTQAIRIDELSKSNLTKDLQKRTGLDNPNSVQQMKEWLSENGMEMESLGKKEVAAAIGDAPVDIAEVLQLRLQLAKSSVRKYQAMQNAVCADGRCHGMFQFYGANRSGRWAGRLIQLQNLPQNHMTDLAEARELVKIGDFEMLNLLYDNVPLVLSELIRTAFIPRPGYKFIVSDFSAIEARVLAHLAGEQWRTEVFKNGGDIYCASASQMFKVPVEKHGQNAHLRQKGKQAELACIAEGSLVLTHKGLVPIEKVTTDHFLWDGESWVKHEGVIYKGEREVITYDGLTATADHLVWVKGQSRPVQLGFAAASGACLLQTGDGGMPIRMGENTVCRETMEQNDEPLLRPDGMHRVRFDTMATVRQPEIRSVKGMPNLLTATDCTQMAGEEIVSCKTALRESECAGIPELWCAWDPVLFFITYISSHISDNGIWDARERNGDRQDRYERRLLSREHPFCVTCGEQPEQTEYCPEQVRAEILAILQKCCDSKTLGWSVEGRNHTGCRNVGIRETEELENHKCTARLYDIRNAGRHHRFTVSGRLVHNCGYGGSVGALKAMGALEMGLAEEELQPLVDMWRSANPNIVQYWWKVDTAVKTAIKQHTRERVGDVTFFWHSGMLFIELPSGRRLAYVKPRIGENQFGGESVTYMGIDAKKKWSRIESYGPKFVENIVQAISRDILCYAMRTLSHCFIVGHVHDELIIEASKDVSLQAICEQMGRTPPWLPGAILRADGYDCDFYRKS